MSNEKSDHLEPSAPPADEEPDEETPVAVAVAIPISDRDSGSESDSSNVPLASHVITTENDAEAEANEIVEESRRQGIASIRSHLDHHLSENPNISYVSWIACLHPENATVSIDPRFFIEGNPWLTVFEEAKNDLQKSGGRPHVLVTPEVTTTDENSQQQSTNQRPAFSGLIDWIIGASLVLLGVMIASVMELIATYAYLSFLLCKKIADRCSNPRITMISFFPFVVSWLLKQIFRLLEVCIFITSIIIVECIALINAILCTIFSLSFSVGKRVHQTTRRLAHHIRWAFRRYFDEWEPSRIHF